MLKSELQKKLKQAEEHNENLKFVLAGYKKKNIQLEKDKQELIEILLAECRYLDNLGGDRMTIGQEMKFTQYSGIIEDKTGKSIEELLK